jgi:hypothetical protein
VLQGKMDPKDIGPQLTHHTDGPEGE